jgi:hypothetical protein
MVGGSNAGRLGVSFDNIGKQGAAKTPDNHSARGRIRTREGDGSPFSHEAAAATAVGVAAVGVAAVAEAAVAAEEAAPPTTTIRASLL